MGRLDVLSNRLHFVSYAFTRMRSCTNRRTTNAKLLVHPHLRYIKPFFVL